MTTSVEKSPRAYDVVEPRIAVLAAEIERLLMYLQFEKEGVPIDITGFRLKDKRQWRTAPARNVFDAIGSLAGTCSARCRFCFEQGVPFSRDTTLLSPQEASTRLRYFDSEQGRGLFHSARPHMEFLTNPAALEILGECRKRDTKSLLVLTTNGTGLTEKVVDDLANLRPVFIKLSLNLLDPKLRSVFMGGRERSNIAVAAPTLLRDREIPYLGSVVAARGIPLEALRQTIGYLAEQRAYGIRVRLPIEHRFSLAPSGNDEVPDWGTLLSWVKALAASMPCPVWAEPTQVWLQPLVPQIDGVVPHSPAALAGLKAGDQVKRIGEKGVLLRDDMHAFVSEPEEVHLPLTMEVTRNGLTLEIEISEEHRRGARYPYTHGLHYPLEKLGMIVLPDVLLSHVATLVDEIETHDASFAVVFASPLCHPTIQQLLREFPPFVNALRHREVRVIHVDSPWMGGNTDFMESRFVTDYEQALHRLRLTLTREPDLVLVPDGFGSEWGTDLLGRSIEELSHRTGIRVVRIPWPLVYGRED